MMARILASLALLLGLAGCEGVGGFALVGASLVSFVHTDKTLTDHAASWVMDEDCSILHSADDEPYCQSAEKIAGKKEGAEAELAGSQSTLYCYRTLGQITCHNRPDPLASEQALVR